LFPFAAIVAFSEKLERRGEKVQLMLFAVATLLGYTVLYKYDSAALQVWYYANLLIPFSILAALAVSARNLWWKSLAVLFVIVQLRNGWRSRLMPSWPSQVGFYEGAMYLRRYPELAPCGSWNAGVIGYFNPSSVINLDGLVNDDVPSFVLAGNLRAYIAQRGISHLLDDRNMLRDEITKKEGGYPGPALTHCVNSESVIWWKHFWQAGDQVSLIELDNSCLKATGDEPTTK
jgi:hypothetical protein